MTRPYRLSHINALCINQSYSPKDQSMKFSGKSLRIAGFENLSFFESAILKNIFFCFIQSTFVGQQGWVENLMMVSSKFLVCLYFCNRVYVVSQKKRCIQITIFHQKIFEPIIVITYFMSINSLCWHAAGNWLACNVLDTGYIMAK